MSDSSWDLGELGERVVAEFLKHHDWLVFNVNSGDRDRAPIFEGLGDGIILPDLCATKVGAQYWVEVKTKTAPVPFILGGGELRHGIEEVHYNDYKRVQKATQQPVWLFIFEREDELLCYQDLNRLPVIDFEAAKDNDSYDEDMVFFDRSEFNIVRVGFRNDEFEFGQQRLDSYGEFKEIGDVFEIDESDGSEDGDLSDYGDA